MLVVWSRRSGARALARRSAGVATVRQRRAAALLHSDALLRAAAAATAGSGSGTDAAAATTNSTVAQRRLSALWGTELPPDERPRDEQQQQQQPAAAATARAAAANHNANHKTRGSGSGRGAASPPSSAAATSAAAEANNGMPAVWPRTSPALRALHLVAQPTLPLPTPRGAAQLGGIDSPARHDAVAVFSRAFLRVWGHGASGRAHDACRAYARIEHFQRSHKPTVAPAPLPAPPPVGVDGGGSAAPVSFEPVVGQTAVAANTVPPAVPLPPHAPLRDGLLLSGTDLLPLIARVTRAASSLDITIHALETFGFTPPARITAARAAHTTGAATPAPSRRTPSEHAAAYGMALGGAIRRCAHAFAVNTTPAPDRAGLAQELQGELTRRSTGTSAADSARAAAIPETADLRNARLQSLRADRDLLVSAIDEHTGRSVLPSVARDIAVHRFVVSCILEEPAAAMEQWHELTSLALKQPDSAATPHARDTAARVAAAAAAAAAADSKTAVPVRSAAAIGFMESAVKDICGALQRLDCADAAVALHTLVTTGTLPAALFAGKGVPPAPAAAAGTAAADEAAAATPPAAAATTTTLAAAAAAPAFPFTAAMAYQVLRVASVSHSFAVAQLQSCANGGGVSPEAKARAAAHAQRAFERLQSVYALGGSGSNGAAAAELLHGRVLSLVGARRIGEALTLIRQARTPTADGAGAANAVEVLPSTYHAFVMAIGSDVGRTGATLEHLTRQRAGVLSKHEREQQQQQQQQQQKSAAGGGGGSSSSSSSSFASPPPPQVQQRLNDLTARIGTLSAHVTGALDQLWELLRTASEQTHPHKTHAGASLPPVPLDRATYTSALRIFADARDTNRAWAVWDRMCADDAPRRAALAHNRALARAEREARVAAAAAGNPMPPTPPAAGQQQPPQQQRAVAVADVLLDHVSVATALSAAAHTGDVSHALAVYDTMKRIKLAPTTLIFNLFLKALIVGQEHARLDGVLTGVEQAVRHAADAAALEAAAKGTEAVDTDANNGDVSADEGGDSTRSGAAGAQRGGGSITLPFDRYTYDMLLAYFAARADVGALLKWWKLMQTQLTMGATDAQARRFMPSPRAYHALLQGFTARDGLAGTVRVWQLMVDDHAPVNALTARVLVALVHGELSRARPTPPVRQLRSLVHALRAALPTPRAGSSEADGADTADGGTSATRMNLPPLPLTVAARRAAATAAATGGGAAGGGGGGTTSDAAAEAGQPLDARATTALRALTVALQAYVDQLSQSTSQQHSQRPTQQKQQQQQQSGRGFGRGGFGGGNSRSSRPPTHRR